MKELLLVARRLSIVGLLTLLMSSMVAPAAGAASASTGWNEETGIYDMVFPVDGDNRYDDTWGACRGPGCSRRHEGTDIMADKMTPIVAAASGTVGWTQDQRGGKCCALAIDHDDGWRTWYIHMNNDTAGTDDGLGWGFAPGIASGVHVEAGQLIGYVGDSGNAETTPPHLHFELQRPDGTEIDPYENLRQAEALAPELGTPVTEDYTREVLTSVSIWAVWTYVVWLVVGALPATWRQ